MTMKRTRKSDAAARGAAPAGETPAGAADVRYLVTNDIDLAAWLMVNDERLDMARIGRAPAPAATEFVFLRSSVVDEMVSDYDKAQGERGKLIRDYLFIRARIRRESMDGARRMTDVSRPEEFSCQKLNVAAWLEMSGEKMRGVRMIGDARRGKWEFVFSPSPTVVSMSKGFFTSSEWQATLLRQFTEAQYGLRMVKRTFEVSGGSDVD